jgi:hypothetical protein
MWQRIFSFLCWLWTGFFVLVGLVGIARQPAIALTFIVWGLVFLPPLFRFTNGYGWVWNICGRIAALFISLIVGAVFTPPQPQITQSPPVTKTPNAQIIVGESGSKITPTPIFTPTPQPTPTLEPTSIPSVIETPEPEAIPFVIKTNKSEATPSVIKTNKSSEPVAPAQVDSNAPVRAAVSGSCDCPYDTDRRGRSCGARSAYSRPGGSSPVCYVSDRQ